MGMYLNSSRAGTLYKSMQMNPYFVDKSLLLKELFPLVEHGNQYICITRPRGFGKTAMVNMIGSFFGKGNSEDLFDHLAISKEPGYVEHMNHHNVVYIPFNEMPRKSKEYRSYIERIETRLLHDLIQAYPTCHLGQNDALWDAFRKIYENDSREKFIFVLDEWDYIFRHDFATENEKMDFIEYLNKLLRNQPYVEFAYMTGILPMAKCSGGRKLNMFDEDTMDSWHLPGENFGFTESEVNVLYDRYVENTAEPRVSREGQYFWQNDSCTRTGEQLYNPRSVVRDLRNNQLLIG